MAERTLEEIVRAIAREEAQRAVMRAMAGVRVGTYDSRANFPPGTSSKKAAARAIKRTLGHWHEDDGNARSRIYYVTAADYHASRRRGPVATKPALRVVANDPTDDDLAEAAIAAAGLRRTGGTR